MSQAETFAGKYNRAHRNDHLTIIERSDATVAPESQDECTVLDFPDGSKAFAADYAGVILPTIKRAA